MGKREYTISKGQQYDRNGALVLRGSLWCSYRSDGRYDTGHPVRSDDAELVEAAVLRVIASGQAETLTLGTETVETVETVKPISSVCPRCHTYCMGDCSSH